MEPIEIDGRTGEGGGQLVRIAVGLAALTTKPIRVTNIRANRSRPGLKTQHFTAIKCLAEVTDAEVNGLRVGSTTLEFIPRRPCTEVSQRNIKISPKNISAASTLLVLQAILPFFLFASDEDNSPISITIHGGTHTSFSLTYDYFDLVLMPTLEERFGIQVSRVLHRRGWSMGSQTQGQITVTLQPIPRNQSFLFSPPLRPPSVGTKIRNIEAIMLLSDAWADDIQGGVIKQLDKAFPGTEVTIKPTLSRSLRWYILLIAHTPNGLRFGKDLLFAPPKKESAIPGFISEKVKELCQGLEAEVKLGGEVDEHLQDQVVVFQALCSGLSSFPRQAESLDLASSPDSLADAMGKLTLDSDSISKEDAWNSLHTQTARWVVKKILPEVEFYNGGRIVRGVGLKFGE